MRMSASCVDRKEGAVRRSGDSEVKLTLADGLFGTVAMTALCIDNFCSLCTDGTTAKFNFLEHQWITRY